MNRTDRLLAIVLELQGKGQQRAEDLAATFEVSKRTIYRDITALSEAGVPLVAAPGQGYALVEGYFLPPLSFDSREAIMLLLGSQVMADSFDAEYRAVAESAGRKIAGVLPANLRDEVAALRESMQFVTAGVDEPTGHVLPRLRQAVLESRRVRFLYHTRLVVTDQPENEREADPYALIHMTGAWYLVAYCHLRQGIRHFRLDRVEELQLLNKRFTRPARAEFAWRDRTHERSITVRAIFDPSVARWVLEDRYFYVTQSEMTRGGLLVTMRVREVQEVLRWLLGWGSAVCVLEPPELCQLISTEAEKLRQNHQNSGSLLT